MAPENRAVRRHEIRRHRFARFVNARKPGGPTPSAGLAGGGRWVVRVRVGGRASDSPGHRERRLAGGGAAVELLRLLAATRQRRSPPPPRPTTRPRASMEAERRRRRLKKKVLVAIGAAAGVVGIALYVHGRRRADRGPVPCGGEPPGAAVVERDRPAAESSAGRRSARGARQQALPGAAVRQGDRGVQRDRAVAEQGALGRGDLLRQPRCQRRDAFAEAEADARPRSPSTRPT